MSLEVKGSKIHLNLRKFCAFYPCFHVRLLLRYFMTYIDSTIFKLDVMG